MQKSRYGIKFQGDIKQLALLQSTSDKISVLRELCKAIGIVLESRDYHIDNNLSFLIDSEPQYDWAPFNMSNVLEFRPIMKVAEQDKRPLQKILSAAKRAFAEGKYEEAFELYQYCAGIEMNSL